MYLEHEAALEIRMEHETTLALAGEAYPALVQYEFDEGDGANAICISAVILRHCIAQRGDVIYRPDGNYRLVYSPEYIEMDIFKFLKGSQLKGIAEEIYESLQEDNPSC